MTVPGAPAVPPTRVGWYFAVVGVGLLFAGIAAATNCTTTLPPGCANPSPTCLPSTLCPDSEAALPLLLPSLFFLTYGLIRILGPRWREPEAPDSTGSGPSPPSPPFG
jgi:hypothetical protein